MFVCVNNDSKCALNLIKYIVSVDINTLDNSKYKQDIINYFKSIK